MIASCIRGVDMLCYANGLRTSTPILKSCTNTRDT